MPPGSASIRARALRHGATTELATSVVSTRLAPRGGKRRGEEEEENTVVNGGSRSKRPSSGVETTTTTTTNTDKRPRNDVSPSPQFLISRRKEGKRTYFDKVLQVTKDGDGDEPEEYTVGDMVFVMMEASSTNTCSVARLDALFEEKDDCGVVTGMATCTWFYSVDEMRNKGATVTAKSDEVFETDHVDNIDVDCLDGHCLIVRGGAIAEGDIPVFLCTRFFSIFTGLIRPVAITGKPPPPHQSPPAMTIHQSSSNPRIAEFDRAVCSLRLSAEPSQLPCRETERNAIYRFIETYVNRGGSENALYISGVPGTGKTATVHQVIRELQTQQVEGKVAPFHVVELNGVLLQSPQEAYKHLARELGVGDFPSAITAAQALEAHFNHRQQTINNEPCKVIVIDELDYMVNKSQTVLYNLFDWPSRPQARIVMICIANTMDLPERMLSKIQSRLGLNRVTFKPYNEDQLVVIIKSRLQTSTVFNPDAIEFCARKAANMSGDVRRALHLCRRAIEICRREKETQIARGDKTVMVNPEDVICAAKELDSRLYVKFLPTCSALQKLFVIATAKLVKSEIAQTSSNSSEVSLVDVWRKMKVLCGLVGNGAEYIKISRLEALQVARRVQDLGLVVLRQVGNELEPLVSLVVDVEELTQAFVGKTDDRLNEKRGALLSSSSETGPKVSNTPQALMTSAITTSIAMLANFE